MQSCFFLELHCREHGDVRMIVGEGDVPGTSYRSYCCPICGALCACALLGSGETTRVLPVWERVATTRSLGRRIQGAIAAAKAEGRVETCTT